VRLFLGMLVVGLLAQAAVAAPPPAPGMRLSSYEYGSNPRQVLDIFVPKGARGAPLILFVHGGGWSGGAKGMGLGKQAEHFTAKGYAWAVFNYRLVPDAAVEDQAADVARALAFLLGNARALGIATDRVVLVGHSSGAQLAGLVATDPQWLVKAKVPFSVIRGVVSLDGAGIDVPGIMAAGASRSAFYKNAFGDDVARQTRLSPLANLGAPDAPAWLLVYDSEHNMGAGFFAERFAAFARKAGVKADVVAATGTDHMKLLGDIGRSSSSVNESVDRFIDAVFRSGAQ